MTTGITVNIQGEDINKMIAQAILDSTLGNSVKEAVTKVITKATDKPYSGDSEVVGAVRTAVFAMIGQIVRDEYGDIIREQIRAELNKRLADDGKLVGEVVGNMLHGKYRD